MANQATHKHDRGSVYSTPDSGAGIGSAILAVNVSALQFSPDTHVDMSGDKAIEKEGNSVTLVCTTSSTFDHDAHVGKGGNHQGTCTVVSSVLAIIGAIGLIVTFVVISYRSGRLPWTTTDYGVVFDAGSTHTAMMIYSWNSEKRLNGTGTPNQVFKCLVDGNGISNYAGDRYDELKDISECLEQCRAMIPANRIVTCPVFFGATAGMRLLNAQDPWKTHRIMDAITEALSESGFYHQPSMLHILSGDEEGALGWIQTNYLTRSFFGAKSLYGMLDLGGASTQFAAEVPQGLSVDYVPLELYGSTYNVSVASFLCFGRRQAQNRHRAMLVLDLPDIIGDVVVKDPCLPLGYQFKSTLRKLFSSPCTWSDYWHSRRTHLDLDIEITFIGASSVAQCTTLIQDQLNWTICRKIYNFSQCFEEHDLTAHNTSFIAISGFYEVMNYLNLLDSQPKYLDVISIIKEICTSDWAWVKNKYPFRSIFSKKVETMCYDSTYTFQLLVTGYKFSESTWNRITFEDSVGEADMGWAMGYMINQTNWMPSRQHIPYPSSAIFYYGLSAFFAALMFTAVAIVLRRSINCCCCCSTVNTHVKETIQPTPYYGAI